MTDAAYTATESEVLGDIRVLTPRDVAELRLGWDSRFSREELRGLVDLSPALSVWNVRTGEFLIGRPWRNRSEIATVVEIEGVASVYDLIQAFVQRAADIGFEIAVISEYAEQRKEAFYSGVAFDLIEEITVYEYGSRLRPPRRRPLDLRFEHLDWRNDQVLDELVELDHRAFPWLWWNSRQEFIQYARAEGVSIEYTRDDSGRMIAYIGTTTKRSWGHLDRIAVDPELQGQGLGRRSLDFAVASLIAAGARRVGLSTQATNVASRKLYESYGFRRIPRFDYRIYGRWLTAEREENEEKDGRGE